MDELLKFYGNTDQSIPSNIDFIFGCIVTLISSLIILKKNEKKINLTIYLIVVDKKFYI